MVPASFQLQLQYRWWRGHGGPQPWVSGPPNCSHGVPPPQLQDDSDGSIECVNEEKRLHKKVCNVSYPFFRAKAKVEAGGRVGTGLGRDWEALGMPEKWK